MKRLLLAALIAGGLACDAVSPYRPCRRVPHKTRQMYKVSWKHSGHNSSGTSYLSPVTSQNCWYDVIDLKSSNSWLTAGR